LDKEKEEKENIITVIRKKIGHIENQIEKRNDQIHDLKLKNLEVKKLEKNQKKSLKTFSKSFKVRFNFQMAWSLKSSNVIEL
jgi:predicted RNase H-like nuclease (RuvC/YqgF family)